MRTRLDNENGIKQRKIKLEQNLYRGHRGCKSERINYRKAHSRIIGKKWIILISNEK